MTRELEEQLKLIQSWKDWDNFQKKCFGKPWELCDVDQTALELEREDILSEGVRWHPFSYPYKVDAETVDQLSLIHI